MIMSMIMTNINEVKAKLSEYLDAVASGERVVICKRNRPVAELRAVAVAPAAPRPIGGAKGRLTVPAAFFDPLPADVIEAFQGTSDAASSRAAEPNPRHSASRRRKRPAR
jgi:prevent-host-death family protein